MTYPCDFCTAYPCICFTAGGPSSLRLAVNSRGEGICGPNRAPFSPVQILSQLIGQFSNRLPCISQLISPNLFSRKERNRERYHQSDGSIPMHTSMGNYLEKTYQERLATLPEINGKLAKSPVSARYGISRTGGNRNTFQHGFKLALSQIQTFLRARINPDVRLWACLSSGMSQVASGVGSGSCPPRAA